MKRLGIRLRRDAVLENGPIQIGTLLAEVLLSDGTTLADVDAAQAAGEMLERKPRPENKELGARS